VTDSGADTDLMDLAPSALAEHHDPPGPERIADLAEVRRYIDAIDFTPMINKMGDDHHGGLGWSVEKLRFVERQYKNWLFLRRKYEGETLPPSVAIDEFWHRHILDTRPYHRDCSRIFGYYLHHFPYLGLRGEADRQALIDAWERTRAHYREEFDDDIWEFEEE
jgi:hypothetical protein